MPPGVYRARQRHKEYHQEVEEEKCHKRSTSESEHEIKRGEVSISKSSMKEAALESNSF